MYTIYMHIHTYIMYNTPPYIYTIYIYVYTAYIILYYKCIKSQPYIYYTASSQTHNKRDIQTYLLQ